MRAPSFVICPLAWEGLEQTICRCTPHNLAPVASCTRLDLALWLVGQSSLSINNKMEERKTVSDPPGKVLLLDSKRCSQSALPARIGIVPTTEPPPRTIVHAAPCFAVQLLCSSGPLRTTMMVLDCLLQGAHTTVRERDHLRVRVVGQAACALTCVEVQTASVKRVVRHVRTTNPGTKAGGQDGTTECASDDSHSSGKAPALMCYVTLPPGSVPEQILLHFNEPVDMVECFARSDPWVQVVGDIVVTERPHHAAHDCVGADGQRCARLSLWPALNTRQVPGEALVSLPPTWMSRLPLRPAEVCTVFSRCGRVTGDEPRHPRTCIRFTEQPTCQVMQVAVACDNSGTAATVPLPVHTGDCVTHLEFRVSSSPGGVAWCRRHWTGGYVAVTSAASATPSPQPVGAVVMVQDSQLSLPVPIPTPAATSLSLRAVTVTPTTPLFTWAGPRDKCSPPRVPLFLTLVFQRSAGPPPFPLHVLAGVTTLTLSRAKLAASQLSSHHMVFPRVRLLARTAKEEGGDVWGTVVQWRGQVNVFTRAQRDGGDPQVSPRARLN